MVVVKSTLPSSFRVAIEEKQGSFSRYKFLNDHIFQAYLFTFLLYFIFPIFVFLFIFGVGVRIQPYLVRVAYSGYTDADRNLLTHPFFNHLRTFILQFLFL